MIQIHKKTWPPNGSKILISDDCSGLNGRQSYSFTLCLQVSSADNFANSGTRSGGAQWLRGRVLDLRPRGREFEFHRRHCVVFLSKTHLSLFNPGRPVPT